MRRIRSVVLRTACVIALVGAIPSSARAAPAAVGIVAGLHHGGISGDAPQDVEFGSRSGLLIGVQAEVGIGDDVSISLQPMFVRRGATLREAESRDAPAANLALDYFAVPLLMKITSGRGRTYVVGGLDFAFLDAATLSSGGEEVDITEAFTPRDIAAVVGFGVIFPVGRPRLTIEARYLQGIESLVRDGVIPPDQNLPDRFHNTGLQFTAGFLFPLGRP